MNKEAHGQFNRQSSFSSTSPTIYEKDLKVDKRILEIMRSGGNTEFPSLNQFFGRIINQTNVQIEFTSTFKDRQGNEIPIVKVNANNVRSLEAASALIMEHLDPHRDKMTFNIDVPFNDHSYIIGKDGSRIKLLSRETGCHIHLPDCNKTSGKKSNKLSIAGTSFQSIEQARNQIRKSLPLNVGFKARIRSKKFVHIDTSSSEVQAIKRKHRVDVTFTNVISNNKFTEITINVKGGRSQLEDIKSATQELHQFVTGEDIFHCQSIDFTITIDISHSHHQYVKGKNNCNLKVIHQRSKSTITFPPIDSEANQVLIQAKDLLSTVMGWQELMGYLPLLLSFDINFDISKVFSDIQKLEKEYGVGIRIREKLCAHVYTVLIKTQERHSICLQEIRIRILQLKTKADKVFDESNMTGDFNKSNAVNLPQIKQSNTSRTYLGQVNLMNSNMSACNTSPDNQAYNYPSNKYLRLSVPKSDDLSYSFDSCCSFPNGKYSAKPEDSAKHLLNGQNYLPPLINFLHDQEMNQLMESSKSVAALNSLTASIIDSNISFMDSINSLKSISDPGITLKTFNPDYGYNSFDSYKNSSQTTFSNLRPRSSTWNQSLPCKVETQNILDYSFSRFSYQNSLYDDSGIGSSMFLSPTTRNARDENEYFNNQENTVPKSGTYLAKTLSKAQNMQPVHN